MLKLIEKNEKLDEKIKTKGLKKAWIAKKAGLDASVLSRIVTGVKNPTMEEATKIATVLECAIDDIF